MKAEELIELVGDAYSACYDATLKRDFGNMQRNQRAYTELLAAIRTLVSDRDSLLAENAKMKEILTGLHKMELRHDGRNGDWACIECKPNSHMLTDGFRCAYHRACSIVQELEAK